MGLKHSPEQSGGNGQQTPGSQAHGSQAHGVSNVHDKSGSGQREGKDNFAGQSSNREGNGSDQMSAAKAKARQTGEEVKDAAVHTATEVSDEVREKVSGTVKEFQQGVSEVTDDIRHQAETMAEDRKSQASDRLGGIASTLRETGNHFEENDESTLAYYTSSLAEQIDSFSESLRNREIGVLMQDARDLAHRQPELFVTGALAAGFLIGRFLKSSAVRQEESRGYDEFDGGYTSRRQQLNPSPYGAGADYNSGPEGQPYGRAVDTQSTTNRPQPGNAPGSFRSAQVSRTPLQTNGQSGPANQQPPTGLGGDKPSTGSSGSEEKSDNV